MGAGSGLQVRWKASPLWTFSPEPYASYRIVYVGENSGEG